MWRSSIISFQGGTVAFCLFSILMLCSTVDLRGQGIDRENLRFIVVMKSGDSFRGNVIGTTDSTLQIQTEFNRVTIAKGLIQEFIPINGPYKKRPHHFLMPTASPNGPGGFLSNYELGFFYGGFGLDSIATITAGLSTVPTFSLSSQLYHVGAKFTLEQSEDIALALGATYSFITTREPYAHLYAVSTTALGNARWSAILFYRISGDEFAPVELHGPGNDTTRFNLRYEGALGVGLGIDGPLFGRDDMGFFAEIWNNDVTRPQNTASVVGIRVFNERASADFGLALLPVPFVAPSHELYLELLTCCSLHATALLVVATIVMELLFPLLLFAFGSFTEPVDLDIDIEGNLYVVDAGRDLVVKYSPEGDSLNAVGGFGRGIEEFDRPSAVYARRGTDVFVVDHNNHRIQRFDRQLDYITTIQTRDDPDERLRFGYPLDVMISRQGDIVILDGENQRIVVFDPSGRFIRGFGDVASGEGALVDPIALELDGADNVYVLDGGTIKAYDPFGAWLRSIPLPAGINVHTFVVESNTMMISADSLLLLYDLEKRAMVDTVGVEPDYEPVAICHNTNMLYVVEGDHIDVRKLHGFDKKLLQEKE